MSIENPTLEDREVNEEGSFEDFNEDELRQVNNIINIDGDGENAVNLNWINKTVLGENRKRTRELVEEYRGLGMKMETLNERRKIASELNGMLAG